jgi:hypothetical protein
MKFNTTIYLILTTVLVLTAAVLTYYFTARTKAPHRQKGYIVSFPYKCSDSEIIDEFKRARKYETYILSADSINNDTIIRLVSAALTKIKQSNDSVNGVHVQFSDNTPYKYYLKTIGICVKNTRLFVPYENDIYAACRSKFQIRQDSIAVKKHNKENVLHFE